jgi:hypothetical protein
MMQVILYLLTDTIGEIKIDGGVVRDILVNNLERNGKFCNFINFNISETQTGRME